jgi:hypothetical protein
LHHVEEAVLGTIPDKFAYIFYSGQAKARKKPVMTIEQFSKSPTALKTKKYMYTALLTFLLLQGIYHLVHAGWQALNATVVGVDGTHAVEIGEAVIEVIKGAAGEGAAGARAAGHIADMTDIIDNAVSIAAEVDSATTAAAAAASTPNAPMV